MNNKVEFCSIDLVELISESIPLDDSDMFFTEEELQTAFPEGEELACESECLPFWKIR